LCPFPHCLVLPYVRGIPVVCLFFISTPLPLYEQSNTNLAYRSSLPPLLRVLFSLSGFFRFVLVLRYPLILCRHIPYTQLTAFSSPFTLPSPYTPPFFHVTYSSPACLALSYPPRFSLFSHGCHTPIGGISPFFSCTPFSMLDFGLVALVAFSNYCVSLLRGFFPLTVFFPLKLPPIQTLSVTTLSVFESGYRCLFLF